MPDDDDREETVEELFRACARLDDADLIRGLEGLVSREKESLADVLVHLSEFDCRLLHGDQGCSSAYVFCTRKLGYSEGAAYRRIYAARAARRFPMVLELVRA
ncbi:MAG: hypothetical protein ABII00_04740, partial [Elusimicrobiota bacterium]